MRYDKISCDACGKEVKPGERYVEATVQEAPRPVRAGEYYTTGSSTVYLTLGPASPETKAGQFHYTCVSIGDDHNCDQHKCRCCR